MNKRKFIAERNAVDAWHWLKVDKRIRNYGREPLSKSQLKNYEAAPGYVYTETDSVYLYVSGLHGCIDLLDSLRFAPGPVVCRVKMWGDADTDIDQLAARHREIVWMGDATRVLRNFQRWCLSKVEIFPGKTVNDLLNFRTELSRDGRLKETWGGSKWQKQNFRLALQTASRVDYLLDRSMDFFNPVPSVLETVNIVIECRSLLYDKDSAYSEKEGTAVFEYMGEQLLKRMNAFGRRCAASVQVR